MKHARFVWKKGLQKRLQKKVIHQSQTKVYFHVRRPLGQQPRVRTFQTRNSCSVNSWSTDRNSCRKSGLGSKSLQQELNALLKIAKVAPKSWSKHWNKCWNKCWKIMLKQMLVIWHALGEGPANFGYMPRRRKDPHSPQAGFVICFPLGVVNKWKGYEQLSILILIRGKKISSVFFKNALIFKNIECYFPSFFRTGIALSAFGRK